MKRGGTEPTNPSMAAQQLRRNRVVKMVLVVAEGSLSVSVGCGADAKRLPFDTKRQVQP